MLVAGASHRNCPPGLASDPVGEFYTHHPYPPPVENLDRARDEWLDPNRHRAEYHTYWPERVYRADLDILVAGCGTWQAARYALCHPAAHVTGIDVSTTSIDHTDRLRRKYNLTNLDLERLPIERIATLERRFDLIVCTGVLHHLADPDEGLRALRSVLKPDGALLLMVYGSYGRVGIEMLQDYCRRLGVGTSPAEVDDLAAILAVLPPHHPAAALLRGARDAHDRDALADALLNPRERSYSVPALLEFIERNGFMLARWQMQAPYLPQCGAISTTQHALRLGALAERDQYAAMELWRGTVAHHTAVLYRSDTTLVPWRMCFDPRFVPIRLPSTLCVRERLPAGAAAVLLNRGHLQHDLIVPIDAEEKRMFDGIDGQRNIAAIVATAGRERVRARAPRFFEKLWWYDQVVFDASRTES